MKRRRAAIRPQLPILEVFALDGELLRSIPARVTGPSAYTIDPPHDLPVGRYRYQHRIGARIVQQGDYTVGPAQH